MTPATLYIRPKHGWEVLREHDRRGLKLHATISSAIEEALERARETEEATEVLVLNDGGKVTDRLVVTAPKAGSDKQGSGDD